MVVHSSSTSAFPGNAAWKAVDGKFLFSSKANQPNASSCDIEPVCEGWNAVGSFPEFIVFDLGACFEVDGFALWATGDAAHDPQSMALDVSDVSTGLSATGWVNVANFSGAAGNSSRQEFRFHPFNARWVRWQIKSTCCGPKPHGYQSFVKEVEFHVSTSPTLESGPASLWRLEHGLDERNDDARRAAEALTPVAVANLTARTSWDAFTEMDAVATELEVSSALSRFNDDPLAILVAEYREFQLRGSSAVPSRWAAAANMRSLNGTTTLSAGVVVGEYFTFQGWCHQWQCAGTNIRLRHHAVRKFLPG